MNDSRQPRHCNLSISGPKCSDGLKGYLRSFQPLMHMFVVLVNNLRLDIHSEDVLRLDLPDDLADVVLRSFQDSDERSMARRTVWSQRTHYMSIST